jgi:hypothetical protein
VLVVVEDRNVQPLLQLPLDLEAPGCRDVLQVDPAERRREPHHGLDDLVDVRAVQGDRNRVHATELLEQDRLALHHREGGLGSDVPEPQHGRTVRHDGHDR